MPLYKEKLIEKALLLREALKKKNIAMDFDEVEMSPQYFQVYMLSVK